LDALVITGPTASGKSELALKLAHILDGEIISADSAQVYRGMDIGTAKPSQAVRQRTPHHLVDIREPNQPYSAADFRTDALRIISEIKNRGKTPIVTGGTMLYLKTLKLGLAELPAASKATRKEIEFQAEQYGWAVLHEELKSIDPISAKRIKPNDVQRLQRAIEVFRLSGMPLSDHLLKEQKSCPVKLTEIAIFPEDRSDLHKKIEDRFQKMLAAGFIDEVRRLKLRADLNSSLPALKAVGYRQIWSYLSGDLDKQTMTSKVLASTRQLAKRQLTWLRGWNDMFFVSQPDEDQVVKILYDNKMLDNTETNFSI